MTALATTLRPAALPVALAFLLLLTQADTVWSCPLADRDSLTAGIRADDDTLDETIRSHRRVVESGQCDAGTYADLGWCYYLKGDYANCIRYSEKALDLEPQCVAARFNTALAYLQLGWAQHARSLYGLTKRYCDRKGIDVDPRVVLDLQTLIRLDVMADEAKEILEKVFGAAAAERPDLVHAYGTDGGARTLHSKPAR